MDKPPGKKPRALLLDFDGVLVDTEPIHLQAWQETLAPLSIQVQKKDYYDRYIGLNDRDFLAKLFAERGHPLTDTLRDELIRKKEITSRRLLSQKIPVVPGAGRFLKEASEQCPLALVTGALANEVYFILDAKGWRDFFKVIITANDVVKGKPDPEGYLKACEKLCALQKWDPPLAKEDCLIYEDSANGVLAAKNAGIPCKVFRGRF